MRYWSFSFIEEDEVQPQILEYEGAEHISDYN